MIDVVVARDKLAGFETSSEIAEFLTDQGVKALRGVATSCAISKWIQEVTGNPTIVTTYGSIGYYDNPSEGLQSTHIKTNTDAMSDFVSDFDNGMYPALVIGGG